MRCNKRTYWKTGGLSEIQSGVLIRQVRVRQTVSTLRSTDKAGELEPVANHPAGTRFNLTHPKNGETAPKCTIVANALDRTQPVASFFAKGRQWGMLKGPRISWVWF